jgi:hypothetical protein
VDKIQALFKMTRTLQVQINNALGLAGLGVKKIDHISVRSQEEAKRPRGKGLKNFFGFHRVSQGFTGFHRVSQGFTGFYRVLQGFTGYHRVSQGFTGFYRVSQGFTGFHRVSQGFTGFHRLSQAFTGFHRVSQGFTGLLRIAQGNSFPVQFFPCATKLWLCSEILNC